MKKHKAQLEHACNTHAIECNCPASSWMKLQNLKETGAWKRGSSTINSFACAAATTLIAFDVDSNDSNESRSTRSVGEYWHNKQTSNASEDQM